MRREEVLRGTLEKSFFILFPLIRPLRVIIHFNKKLWQVNPFRTSLRGTSRIDVFSVSLRRPDPTFRRVTLLISSLVGVRHKTQVHRMNDASVYRGWFIQNHFGFDLHNFRQHHWTSTGRLANEAAELKSGLMLSVSWTRSQCYCWINGRGNSVNIIRSGPFLRPRFGIRIPMAWLLFTCERSPL